MRRGPAPEDVRAVLGALAWLDGKYLDGDLDAAAWIVAMGPLDEPLGRLARYADAPHPMPCP